MSGPGSESIALLPFNDQQEAGTHSGNADSNTDVERETAENVHKSENGDLSSDETSCTSCCHSWWCGHKKLNLILWIVICLVGLCGIVQVLRFGLLVTLIDVHSRQRNISEIRSKLDYMIKVTSQITFCFDYIVLLYGICKFRCYYCKTNLKPAENVKGVWKFFWKSFRAKRGIKICVCTTLIALLPSLHLAVSMAPPVILLIWRKEILFLYSNPVMADVYASCAIVDHLYNFYVRIGMLFVTVFVIFAWKRVKEEIRRLNDDQNAGKINHLLENYTSTGELVNAFQDLFQAWFVIKWIIYFTDIIGQSILAAEAIFNPKPVEDEYSEHELIFAIVHLFYDFSAFIYLFLCGSLMNWYHTDYRQYQQEQLREYFKSREEINELGGLVSLQCCNTLIPEVSEYEFLPSICLINFPLSSPGYTLTMFLTLIAFLVNFLSQFWT